MTRYEVAVNTPLCSGSWGRSPPAVVARTAMNFDGHRFVWHERQETEGQPSWPVVTIMVGDAADYTSERLATNRLLSALSFQLDLPMTIVGSVSTGWLAELDHPMLSQPGQGGGVLHAPISLVAVEPDERLRLVLAHYREGRSANSPFYRFLALYNALDAAFDADASARSEFIRERLAATAAPDDSYGDCFDWADYLRDTLRNAVAHAVRPQGKPALNPDDLANQGTLDRASGNVASLVRQRVTDRWPRGVLMT